MGKKIIVFFFMVFLVSHAIAQNTQDLKFKHLTANDGLSHNTVNCFVQDSQGYMWIGTQNGLNRYDGYGFEVYLHDKKPYSIPSNYITRLYKDKRQNIWIGTSEGVCKYDNNYNQFIRIPEIKNKNVFAFLEDSEGKLWVAAANLLFYLDSKINKFVNYPQFTENAIFSFIALDKDKFLVATQESGFYILNIKTGKTQQFLHQAGNEQSLCYNNIIAVDKDHKGYIWIGTEKGLDRFDPKTLTFVHFKEGIDSKKNLIKGWVSDVKVRGNEVWIGTENGGLSKIDLNTMLFTHYIPAINNPESISSLSIWTMYWDEQNRLWVGTFMGGANVADPHREKFSTPNLTLKNKIVNAILKDSKNRLWVGTEGGLVVWDGEKAIYYTHNPLDAKSLPNDPVLAIYEDNKNRIWIGTWDGGLSLFNEKSKNFATFKANPNNPNKLANQNIFVIHQSSLNSQITALSGGYKSGFHILTDEFQQNFINYLYDDATKILGNWGKCIYEDAKRNLWIGTDAGLHYFDVNTKKIKQYLHQESDTTSLINNQVQCMLIDSKGRFWLGTATGLSQMVDENKFINYTTFSGLANNSINGILEDGKGNLWLSTNIGICKFNPETKKVRNYNDSDGLQGKEFKSGSYFKTKDGQLFFGGSNGFNAFYPDSIKDNLYKPNVLLTDLKIFNQSIKIGEYDSLLTKVISQTREIILTHEHSVFSLTFIGLNFTHSDKNQYAYKLEGFDKDWVYVGNKREAIYTNLDAGTYTFSVKASNNDGLWNEEGASLKIVILPPWWKTWWFRTIATILFLSSGIAFYWIRINAVRKQNAILEKKVAEKTHDLQLKNEALQTIQEELYQNMEELDASHELLIEQKQLIETSFAELNIQNTKINDSIRYAQRIQNAILPHADSLTCAFAEYFVIFKPKDVVSGDFYWYLEIENKKFIAVVDCTGHGVPGAFMSMIGNTLLYEIINAKRIFEPQLILDQLHLGILNALNRKDAKIQDGMDVALCCIEEIENQQVKVKFSGAKRPLYYFSKHELKEVQANKKSIGQAQNVEKNYDLHEFILDKGDILYMITDGWVDAINPERKRFGSKQFKEMLIKGANLPLKAQEEVFRHILEEYEQGSEQRDDVLMVGVRV